jgi:hypothetical protein
MVQEVEPMATNPQKTTWILVALAGLLLTVGLLAVQWWPRWRESTVYQALRSSHDAAFWWPAGWRQELRTSFLLEGYAYLRDGELRPVGGEHSAPPDQSGFGRPAKPGMLELVSESQGQVFRTTVNPKGWYSFNSQPLPAGPFKIRFVSGEGSPTRWQPMGTLDPGRHRINWAF